VCVHGLVPRLHVSPVLEMMIGVDEGEHGMMHVSVLGAAGDVEKIEFDSFSIGRHLARHTRPIAGVTVMGEKQAVPVQVKHGDGIVGSSGPGRLVHERVPHGSHPKRDLHEFAVYFGSLRDGGDVAFPGAGKSFELGEGFLRVRLGDVGGEADCGDQDECCGKCEA